jgi:predicted molibdopterin-dependent oxidoreductase YjgC
MEDNLLDDYEKEIRIRIAGREFSVPENNTLLRILQHLAFEISYSRFCWNGDCHNCLFAYCADGRERQALACRTKVAEGMEVTHLPEGIELN